MFDESFVKAAHLREYSAQERLDEHERPVADVPEVAPEEGAASLASEPGLGRGRAKRRISGQFVGLLLVIVLAFGAAIYMGARSPYQDSAGANPQIPLRATLVPLVPRGTVPGGEAAELFRNSPAARFETAPQAVTLPRAHATAHFSSRQVQVALSTARQYVLASATHPGVLAGKTAQPVRELLTPGQRGQFDRGIRTPAADGQYAATGWLVRFHPDEARLADPGVRVRGTFTATEAGSGALEVTAQHVLVYSLRPAAGNARAKEAKTSLFTVRREVRMRFTSAELRTGVLTVAQVTVQAGPLPCAEDTHDWLRPLLAGEDVGADGSAGTDPYAGGVSRTALCGVLARSAQPQVD